MQTVVELVNNEDAIVLQCIRDVIIRVLSDENASDFMDEKRITTIADLTEQRIRNLESFCKSNIIPEEDSTKDDVSENIAASYQ